MRRKENFFDDIMCLFHFDIIVLNDTMPSWHDCLFQQLF